MTLDKFLKKLIIHTLYQDFMTQHMLLLDQDNENK
jgi:hypothetical protein